MNVQRLRDVMRALRPQPTSNHSTAARTGYVHPDLQAATHVFVRADQVKPPLTPPYSGPFKVVERHDKFLTIDVQNVQQQVSMDRLKPVYVPASQRLLEEHSYANRLQLHAFHRSQPPRLFTGGEPCGELPSTPDQLVMTKTKQRARQILYWPGMTTDIEKMISNCTTRDVQVN